MSAYGALSRAQLSAEYLHANSTTHEFIFGAMAEMIDNARDADATKIEVFTVDNSSQRGGFLLHFLDDGCGMSPKEAHSVITFGKSLKRGIDSKIGHYGNGLKSGTMRLGNDMMVFTKKEDSQTCIFLSRTFLEEEKLEEVVVPIPSFKINSKTPFLTGSEADKEKFKTEMDIILKYSPFHTETELFQQFDIINKKQGTLVIVYNLKLLETGDPELDIHTDETDILLTRGSEDHLKEVPENYSLRRYTSILYYEPRMKIYIQGQKVHTCRLAYSLYKPKYYNFSSVRFKNRCTQDANTASEDVKVCQMKLFEAESKMRQLEKQSFSKPQDRSLRAKYTKATVAVSQLKDELRLKKQIHELAQKSLKEPKVLKFIFGINVLDRSRQGVFVYNCGRLIKMYQRVGPQTIDSLPYRGVLGVVDIPFSVLAPTHNKQDFADSREYQLLLKALGEHIEQYVTDVKMDKEDVEKFWGDFGYTSGTWFDPPSTEPKFVRKRAMNCKTYIQCDKCLKWRAIPFSSKAIEISPNWSCSESTDVSHSKCTHLEEVWSCPEGKLTKVQKATKSKEDLEKDLNKIQKKLSLYKDDEEDEEMDSRPTRTRSSRVGVGSSKVQLRPPVRGIASRPPPPPPAPRNKPAQAISKYAAPPVKPPPPRKKKRVIVESSSDDEIEEPAPKRKAPAPKPTLPARTPPKPLPVRKIIKTETDEPKPSARAAAKRSFQTPIKKPESQVMESEEILEEVTSDSVPQKTNITLAPGQYVSVKVGDQWVNATVKDATSKDLTVNLSSPLTLPVATTSVRPTAPSEEVTSTSDLVDRNTLDKIVSQYKKCLCYFIPPQWEKEKPAINAYNPAELADFSIEDYFTKYQEGLRTFAKGFQDDFDKQEAKLKSLRKLVAKFLSLVDEDLKIEGDNSIDSVDEILGACINQIEGGGGDIS